MQSSSSTCGPASLATIFKYYSVSKLEVEIARAAFSSASGTENWYLIRYARKNGLTVTCMNKKELSEIPVPAMIGTFIEGGIGHFITVLGREGESFIIGDPLRGRIVLTEHSFKKYYTFSGFVMHARKPSGGGNLRLNQIEIIRLI